MLQLLNLIQVMDKGLADLLYEQGSIGNLELHLLLHLFVALPSIGHLLSCEGL